MNPYVDIVIRSVVVYLFMLAAIRFFGKKELSQLNSADIILILLISNSVQNAMVGSNSSLAGGLIAALALFLINFLFKKIMYKFKTVNDLVEDKPLILIHDGRLDFSALSKLEITSQELEEVIREHGVQHFNEVKLAMMEIDGNISVISGKTALKQTHHKRKIHKTLGTLNN